jgi:SAM-dependent methyltransferase
MLFNTAAQLTKRLYYLLWLGPRGYGKPVPKDILLSQYKRGDWDHLRSIDELARYMVIVGYIHSMYKRKSPIVLDVGCGYGLLLELLTPFGFESYLGIDLSSEAIKRAESLVAGNAKFEVADFEKWEAPRSFDIIVFNESLMYAKRPVDVLLRYSRSLNENGLMIVSIFRTGLRRAIWRSLNKYFAVTNSTTVKNQQGQVWDIKVLWPKAL